MKNLTSLVFWVRFFPLILSFIITIITLTTLQLLPAKLPLFYSLAWGEAQLASHQQLLIIPATISLIALLNLIISWQLHSSQSFFKKIFLLSSLILSIVLTIAFIKIILIFI